MSAFVTNGRTGAATAITVGAAAANSSSSPSTDYRDEGLSGSQAHIALNDHTSLFQETKEQLRGISLSPLFVLTLSGNPSSQLFCLCAAAQTVTATRTATCPWRTTTAAPTPPLTPPTARTMRGCFPGRNAGKVWRPAGAGGRRRVTQPQTLEQHPLVAPLQLLDYICSTFNLIIII